jgi:hypothetical protein
MTSICRVSSRDELVKMKQLQLDNVRRNLGAEDAVKSGFLTAEYSVEFLESMHDICPSVIAKCGDDVIGYIIAYTKGMYGSHDLLDSLVEAANVVEYKESFLKDVDYILCGQLCVHKNFRGIGLSTRMYDYFRREFSGRYIYCITDVASDNVPSLRAHAKVGFKTVSSDNYGDILWHVVLWDWNEASSHDSATIL